MVKDIALTALLVAACAVQAAPVADISGIKIGLPLAAQKAGIEKVNPQYKLSEIRTTEGKVVGVEGLAMVGKYKEVTDHFVALQDDAGNVWYLARAQRYESGAYIPLANYVSALKDKYGAPTSQIMDGARSQWSYDRNGVAQVPKAPQVCPISADGTEISKMREDGISVPVPSRFEPNCGIQINATLTSAGNNLIRGSSIVIVDHKPRYDELVKLKAMADAAKQKGLDALKDNKPKL